MAYKLILTFLILVFQILFVRAADYKFTDPANKLECVFEYISEQNVEISGHYSADKRVESVDYSFKISGPKGTILYESSLSADEFLIKASSEGTYRFCFINRNYSAVELGLSNQKEAASEDVMEKMGDEEEEESKLAKSNEGNNPNSVYLEPIPIQITMNIKLLNSLKFVTTDKIANELDILSDELIDIQSEQRYSRLRGYRISMYADKANKNVLIFFFVELTVIIIFVTAQMFYVTNIHKIKNSRMLKNLNKRKNIGGGNNPYRPINNNMGMSYGNQSNGPYFSY